MRSGDLMARRSRPRLTMASKTAPSTRVGPEAGELPMRALAHRRDLGRYKPRTPGRRDGAPGGLATGAAVTVHSDFSSGLADLIGALAKPFPRRCRSARSHLPTRPWASVASVCPQP